MAVTLEGDVVLEHGVAEQVEELASSTEAAGAPQVEVVVDLAVGGFGVAAPSHELGVVGVAR